MNPGAKYVAFIEHLIVPAGDRGNTPLKLQPWQSDFITKVFGTLRPDNSRQFREAALWIPKRNAKSTLAAAIVCASLFLETELRGEIYSVANTREQASVVFGAVAAMLRADPYLRTKVKISDSQKFVKQIKSGTIYKALSADSGDKNGLSPSLVIYDEIGEAPSPELYTKLQTGTGSRKEPLFLSISTAGDRNGFGWERYQYAQKVRDNPSVDPTFLPVIYEAPIDCDWTDLNVWKACNPNFGISLKPDYVEQAIRKGQNEPSFVPQLLRYHLNCWVDRSIAWIPSALWSAMGSELPDLTGRPCYVGLDLASTRDTTALIMLFPLDDGRFAVLPRFYLPRKSAEDRTRIDNVPYLRWAKDSNLILTNTSVTDYDQIRDDLKGLKETFDIRAIGLDPWNAAQLLTQLESDGFIAEPFRQGWVSMGPPSKRFEELCISQKLIHANHPVLKWHANNVVAETDKVGNVMPSKNRSTEKIDGIVGLIIALGTYMKQGSNEGPSVYESQGITFI